MVEVLVLVGLTVKVAVSVSDDVNVDVWVGLADCV